MNNWKGLSIIFLLFCSTQGLADNIIQIDSKFNIIGKEIKKIEGHSDNKLIAFIKDQYAGLGYEYVPISFNEDGSLYIDDSYASIKKIVFKGVGAEHNKKLKEILDLKRNYLFGGWKIEGRSLIRGLNRIKNHYHNNGRPKTNIKSGVKDGVLYIDIQVGKLVRVVETNIKSDINNIELFDRIYGAFEGGKLYSKSTVEKVLMNIKGYLDNNGYVDGVINVDNQEVENGVILNIEIKAGEIYKFGSVGLDGWLLDEGYIFKYIKEGDIYNLGLLKLEILNLNKKRLFKGITPQAIKLGNSINTTIKLVKQKTGLILGGATLAGNDPTIYLKVKEDNFLNRGYMGELSVASNDSGLEIDSNLFIDEKNRISIKVGSFGLGGDSKKYSISWDRSDAGENGMFYGVGVNRYTNCEVCGRYGVEIKYGVRWSRVDNEKNISGGNNGYVSGIAVINEEKNEYFLNGNRKDYFDVGEGIILKTNIFTSFGANGNYFEQKPNAFKLRGIDPTGIDVGDKNSFIFRNKIDLYKKVSILDNQLYVGPYIDMIGLLNKPKDTKSIMGGSVNFETGVGLVELYYGMPFDQSGMLDTKAGIILNNRF